MLLILSTNILSTILITSEEYHCNSYMESSKYIRFSEYKKIIRQTSRNNRSIHQSLTIFYEIPTLYYKSHWYYCTL
jgi:ribosomal protein S26